MPIEGNQPFDKFFDNFKPTIRTRSSKALNLAKVTKTKYQSAAQNTNKNQHQNHIKMTKQG
jgi:hypothetical protein